MASDIQYSLYKDSQPLEATRLRSILLFNGRVENQKRQDLITKAILSLILAEDGSATRDSILLQLNLQFKLRYKPGDLETQIKKLFKLGLIESLKEPLKVKDSDKRGSSFFIELERSTEALLDGILSIASERYAHMRIQEPDKIKNTIRKALSVYFGMNGYSFFGVQKKEDVQINEAVSLVKKDITDSRVSESIIRALADVLEKPDDFQKSVLTKWARAFVAMESMSLDPLLNNFKSKNLREKEFIIDTDVVLYCLTRMARYSEDYRRIIAKLKDLGCRMYLVPEVVNEVQKHIDAARKRYSFYGNQILEYPDDVLYEKVCNVFIDDYVHIERLASEGTPFRFYLSEFSDPDYPALLRAKLVSAFSESALNNSLNVDTKSVEFQQLNAEVLNLTMQTPKARNRSDDDNYAVSYLDTFLYMAASENNRGLDDRSMLSGKTYILTDSSRAVRAANNLGWQKSNVICHPNALMALLMEMGDIKSQETIINLFDNPFLAYVADGIWNEIEPLLQQGATIKYKGFDRLRADVDMRLDQLLTNDMSAEDRHEVLKKYDVYLPDMVYAGKEREEEQKERIAQLEKEVAVLKKSLTEVRSIRAKSIKKPNSPSTRKKKRKK